MGAGRLQRARPPRLQADPWFALNAGFLYIIGLERWLTLFMTGVILLVATFSIAVSLMMSVIRKTREIGLFVAMGAQPREVALSYTFQGFFIGLFGSLFGVGFAVLLLTFREPLVLGFARATGGVSAMQEAYGFVNLLPVHYNLADIAGIFIFSVCIATLAGLIPAWRAARLKPADALRSE